MRRNKKKENGVAKPKSVDGVLWSGNGWFHKSDSYTFYDTIDECAVAIHGAVKNINNKKIDKTIN